MGKHFFFYNSANQIDQFSFNNWIKLLSWRLILWLSFSLSSIPIVLNCNLIDLVCRMPIEWLPIKIKLHLSFIGNLAMCSIFAKSSFFFKGQTGFFIYYQADSLSNVLWHAWINWLFKYDKTWMRWVEIFLNPKLKINLIKRNDLLLPTFWLNELSSFVEPFSQPSSQKIILPIPMVSNDKLVLWQKIILLVANNVVVIAICQQKGTHLGKH